MIRAISPFMNGVFPIRLPVVCQLPSTPGQENDGASPTSTKMLPFRVPLPICRLARICSLVCHGT